MSVIYLVFFFYTEILLDEDYHIYYRRGTKWIALGKFDQAIEDDDECEWEILEGNNYELHLLIVSSNHCFYILVFNITSQSSYNGPVTGSHYVPTTASRTSTPSLFPKPLVSSLISARHIEIMTTLDMDQGLVSNKGARVSLETAWKRYTTIIKAISRVGDADWVSGKKPTDSEVIGVYSSKSVFYDQSKVLQHVRLHPEMVEWLEGSDLDADRVEETTSLWGFYKASYALKDLEKWLEQKQRESRTERKGKGKASQKAKRGDEGEESTGSAPKRIHKKSVGGRK